MDPERETLRQRIDKRFEIMMDDGAVEEVQALLNLGLAEDLPCMRAIGVPEIASWLVWPSLSGRSGGKSTSIKPTICQAPVDLVAESNAIGNKITN